MARSAILPGKDEVSNRRCRHPCAKKEEVRAVVVCVPAEKNVEKKSGLHVESALTATLTALLRQCISRVQIHDLRE